MKYRPGLFLLTIFGSFFLASPAFAAHSVSGVTQVHGGTTATASGVNAIHNGLKAEVDAKQDIITASCTAGESIRVINPDGSVICEVDTVGTVDFGSILSVVGVTGTPGSSSSAQADCPTNEYATGGSCGIPSATTSAAIKIDEPVVAGVGNPPTGWTCTCVAETGQNCQVKASVICAQ